MKHRSAKRVEVMWYVEKLNGDYVLVEETAPLNGGEVVSGAMPLVEADALLTELKKVVPS
jgi:hypothetical protein